MTIIFWLELLTWSRVPALILFLVQYRGRWRSPVAWLLRGFAIVFLLQATTALFVLALSASISPLGLQLALVSQGSMTLWAWFFYVIFLRFRKAL